MNRQDAKNVKIYDCDSTTCLMPCLSTGVQIETCFANMSIFIHNHNKMLPRECNVPCFQFNTQRCFIHRLKVARAKMPTYFDGGSDYCTRKLISF